MDKTDIKIINLLKDNARMTASEISQHVKLSVPAVSERLKKLENSNTIQKYTVILDNKKLNKTLVSYMFLSFEKPNTNNALLDFIYAHPDILECYYVAGEFDYLIKIVTSDTLALENILNKIKSVPGVITTKTIITLSEFKHLYSTVPEEN